MRMLPSFAQTWEPEMPRNAWTKPNPEHEARRRGYEAGAAGVDMLDHYMECPPYAVGSREGIAFWRGFYDARDGTRDALAPYLEHGDGYSPEPAFGL